MKCVIFTIGDQRVFDDLNSVTIPGTNGEMEILPGHAEAFIRLGRGQVVFRSSSATVREEASENSLCYVRDDVISVII